MSPSRTLCVVLHYGSKEDTDACLATLQSEEQLDVIVSDNDPEQSYELPDNQPSRCRIVKTGGSSSFAAGNNIAVAEFLNDTHDSIFILNNDTLVAPGAVSRLRQTLYKGRVGMVGPCMPFASSPEIVWACGGSVNKFALSVRGLTDLRDGPYEVDYLPGAAILCRASVWKEIGGLPDHYFLAYEEAEFALEVHKRGYSVVVNPEAVVLHKVGMSSVRRPEYFYNSVRNRLLFAKYLYGAKLGLCYGIVMTCLLPQLGTKTDLFNKAQIWLAAVRDELMGVPLNRSALQKIASRYTIE